MSSSNNSGSSSHAINDAAQWTSGNPMGGSSSNAINDAAQSTSGNPMGGSSSHAINDAAQSTSGNPMGGSSSHAINDAAQSTSGNPMGGSSSHAINDAAQWTSGNPMGGSSSNAINDAAQSTSGNPMGGSSSNAINDAAQSTSGHAMGGQQIPMTVRVLMYRKNEEKMRIVKVRGAVATTQCERLIWYCKMCKNWRLEELKNQHIEHGTCGVKILLQKEHESQAEARAQTTQSASVYLGQDPRNHSAYFSPKNRFLGICIRRERHALHHQFTLRNCINGLGVEVMYELYNPTILKIETIKLEKRLNTDSSYLQDAYPEFSTFDFNLEAVSHPSGSPVPINETKVKLRPPPWRAHSCSQVTPYFKRKFFVTKQLTNFKYDLIHDYREHPQNLEDELLAEEQILDFEARRQREGGTKRQILKSAANLQQSS
ncbi:putative 39S ribosomal protein L19, mitochondrial [Aphelenchoides besseyi]|nr:putative 39S ribosomal protein L19, mitochondrial [Aphelenchoides besseyi]